MLTLKLSNMCVDVCLSVKALLAKPQATSLLQYVWSHNNKNKNISLKTKKSPMQYTVCILRDINFLDSASSRIRDNTEWLWAGNLLLVQNRANFIFAIAV